MVRPPPVIGRGHPGAGTISASDGRTELSRKLQLTSIALGCPTSKELCARFAAVNPNTAFTVQNAYKWVRGKATPRLASVYEDWAVALGNGFTGSFIAASTLDEFAVEVQARHQVPDAAILRLGGAVRTAQATDGEDNPESLVPLVWQSSHVLCGRYLAISFAWSRGEAGRLILGRMDIEPGGDGKPEARYSEWLFGQLVPMTGVVVGDGRAAQAVLECNYSRRLYLLALQVPSPPANIVGGMLAGSALHDPNTRSIAGRIVLVRDRISGPDPEHVIDYLEPTAEALDGQLAALGYATSRDRLGAAGAILDLLREPGPSPELFEIDPDGIAALGLRFDRLALHKPGSHAASV